jgi:asparagine synthase (glutamine-hydrolysing)
MCGFAGFYKFSNHSFDPDKVIKAMTESLTHRGPDSWGLWVDANVEIAFGHRRLSIQDLTQAGSQPMQSNSGRYVIIFNGEIYNHFHIRKEIDLIDTEKQWQGHSDTETVLAAIETWGITQSVKKFIGMFSFCLWDRTMHELTLCRDRIGEKPLYYGWQGKGRNSCFLFASEIKSLNQHPLFEKKLNKQSIKNYFSFGYIPGPDTIFEGIYKLEPGHIKTISNSNRDGTVHRYWSIEDVASQAKAGQFDGGSVEATQALEKLINNSVSEQMLSDVPVGAFLSGGIDSSIIAAFMQENSSRKIKSFSIGFVEESCNEAVHAKAVADYLQTDHTELYLRPQDLLNIIPTIPSIYDEPFADSSQIPMIAVSKLARQTVKVALSGDAGDELFSGYNRYVFATLYARPMLNTPFLLRNIAMNFLKSIPIEIIDNLASYLRRDQIPVALSDKFQKILRSLPAKNFSEIYASLVALPNQQDYLSSQLHREILGKYQNISNLNIFSEVEIMMLLDSITYLPDDILVKVDRAAMSVGLETRVPFLDHRIIDFAWRLPMSYKMQINGKKTQTKWILRELLKNRLPPNLINPKKMGFALPLSAWLRGPLREWASDTLFADSMSDCDILNSINIKKLFLDHMDGSRNNQDQLWALLMFKGWINHNNL